MPAALSDPSFTLCVILGIIVVLLGGVWLRKRTRGDMLRFACAAGAMLFLVLIDHFIESPREETTRKMRQIALATRAKKLDDAFTHVAESFEYEKITKPQLLEKARQAEKLEFWQGIDVGDFHRADFEKIDDSKVKIGFYVKPAGGAGISAENTRYCWATFFKDADGQYRLKTFDLFPKRPNHPGEKPTVPSQLQ